MEITGHENGILGMAACNLPAIPSLPVTNLIGSMGCGTVVQNGDVLAQ
jgi:hypothetical protein